MNKICGYSCKHNKGGVCQITMCDKQLTFSTTTEKNIEELKQMIEPLKDWKFWEYSCTDEDVKKAMETKSYVEVIIEEQDKRINELQQELQIINELKKYLQENSTRPDLWECDAYYKEILDKIKELENSGSDE